MKKSIVIVLLLLSICVIANSQNVYKFGIAGGLNSSKIESETNTKSLLGFHVGLINELKLPIKLGFEGDIFYSTKGSTIEGVNSNLEKTDLSYTLSYIDVPIVVKYYFVKAVNLHVGPQFSYLLSADYDGTDMKEFANSSDIAVVAGLGVDVLKFHGAIRYNYGITEFGDGDGKNNVIQITLGLWIK